MTETVTAAKRALEAQLADEYRALQGRREEAGLDPAAVDECGAAAHPRIGLALSGGGIRSATYCLGVMRGLARSGLLARFDYLSTVSGGGYAGALWGRLCATHGVKQAQHLFARDDTLLLWWLRRNGRYLTPAGTRDFGMALATYLRAWIAIHIEFGMLMLLLGTAIVAPHWLYRVSALAGGLPWTDWHAMWWPAAQLWCYAIVPGAMAGYWSARDGIAGRRRSDGAMAAFFALGAAAFGLAAWRHARPIGPEVVLPACAALALASCAAGLLLGVFFKHWRGAVYTRNALTRLLRVALLGGATLTVLGVLDRLSWQLMLHAPWRHAATDDWTSTGIAGAALGASLVAIRSGLEPLLRGVNQAAQVPGSLEHWGRRALNLFGLLGLFALVLFWLMVVQTLIFDPRGDDLPIVSSPVWRAALVLGVALVWLLLTGGNTDMPNSASLHSFYRARLVRAYLSVGNAMRVGARFPDAQGSLAPRSSERIGRIGRVTDVFDGDDVPLADYRPESRGGPIHLINACINQTRDDHSGLYDADRKGRMLVVSHRGFEVGVDEVVGPDAAAHADAGTLGRWTSISGAAAAPGAGSYTSPGLALLLLFLGIRLGYWWRALPQQPLRWPWRWFGKPKLLRGEALARFIGTAEPWWYLSDGGHFENTGVYALLKRELDFIVVVDGGSDPRFTYGDLENLVRKARIDFNTEVRFYTAAQAAGLFSLPVSDLAILSPEELADRQTVRGVLLARVTYRSGREGTLVVVKPALHRALELDLLAYAHRNASFPQQGTADQSFDESQWESYHRLGVDMGQAFSGAWLSQIPHWTGQAKRHTAHPAALLRSRVGELEAVGRPWRESAKAVAVSATIGLGATGSLLLPAWYVFDDFRKEQQRLENETAKAREDHARKQTEMRKSLRVIGAAIKPGDACLQPMDEKGVEQVDGLLVHVDEEGMNDIVQDLQLDVQSTLRRLQDSCAAYRQTIAATPEACGAPAETAPRTRLCETLYSRAQKEDSQRQREAWERYWWRPDCDGVRDGMRNGTFGIGACAAVARLWEPVELGTLWRILTNTRTAAAAGDIEQRPESDGGDVVAARPPAAPPATGATPAPGTAQGGGANGAASSGAGTGTASAAREACRRVDGERVRLFTQVYDEAGRAAAQDLLDAVRQAQPLVTTPQVENVRRTAAISGQRPLVPWRRPTLLVHRASEWDCALAIAQSLETRLPAETLRLRMLPRTLTPQPGVIELWLPPTEDVQPTLY